MFAPVWKAYGDHILFAATFVLYLVGSGVALVGSNTWSELLPVPVLGAIPLLTAPPIKRFRRIFALLVVGALGLLAGGEILFRARYLGNEAIFRFTDYTPLPITQVQGFVSPSPDPDMDYIFTPGSRLRFNGKLWEINEEGFRDGPFSFEKPPGVFRILVLGDSFALGVGVEREDRFSNQLEDLLLRSSDTRPVEVYNLGLAGLSHDQLAHVMETYGPRYRADLILIGLRASQVHQRPPDRTTADATPHKRHEPASQEFSFVRRYAFLLNVQREAVTQGLARITAFIFGPNRNGGGAREEHEGPSPFEQLVVRASAFSREHGIDVALVALRKMEFATDTGLRASLANRALGGDSSRHRDHEEIARVASGYGVPVIDTYDVFPPDARRPDHIIFPGDGHPNAAGHRRYAEAIAAWLLEHDRLARSAPDLGAGE